MLEVSAGDPVATWDMIGSVAGGTGALFGLGFAAYAAWTARKLFRIESDRDAVAAQLQQQREKEARRQQAAQVGMWFEYDHTSSPGATNEIETLVSRHLRVTNLSSLPIFMVHVLIVSDSLTSLDPRAAASHRYLDENVITPGGSTRIEWPEDYDDHSMGPRLYFHENAGLYWERELFGELWQGVLTESTGYAFKRLDVA